MKGSLHPLLLRSEIEVVLGISDEVEAGELLILVHRLEKVG